MKIALVTDSTVDLPADVIEQHHIHIVPITLIVDGVTMEDGGGKNSEVPMIDRNKFYRDLPQMKTFPTTAAPSPINFQKVFEHLLNEGYDHILSVNFSKELSATVNNAFLAAENFAGKVTVVDSRQISMTMGFQVLAAAEAIEELSSSASLSPEEVVKEAVRRMNDVRQREFIYALVDTLEYLHKGGRVSWVKAAIGTMLKMKFIISVVDGQVTRVGQVRTRRGGWEKIKELLTPHAPFERMGVFHCGADPEEVNEIAEMFVHYLAPCHSSASVNKPFVIPLTPIIGAHTGPNLIGLAVLSCKASSQS